jgi:hypothetical protein
MAMHEIAIHDAGAPFHGFVGQVIDNIYFEMITLNRYVSTE